MGMAKKIEILLLECDLGKKELAARIGISQSNLSGKLRRDNFSERELQEIAQACDAVFVGHFVINNTGKQI